MEYDRTRRWHSQSTWLQRDLKSLKSLLRMGDTFTSGDVFDSVQFRGVQLMSDDEMLPDSQRGFAPTIRGMAHSNAKVTISAWLRYLRNVCLAGGVCDNDLYPTAQSGDLRSRLKRAMVRCGPLPSPFQPSRLCCAKDG
jgi:outer membrane usher protein